MSHLGEVPKAEGVARQRAEVCEDDRRCGKSACQMDWGRSEERGDDKEIESEALSLQKGANQKSMCAPQRIWEATTPSQHR